MKISVRSICGLAAGVVLAACASGSGEGGGTPVTQLNALVDKAEAQDRASHEAGVTPAEFLQQRTALGDTLEAAYKLCEGGAPDSRLGNQCALTFAMRRLNDSVKNANQFMDATSASPPDWTRIADQAARFQNEVETNWPKYYDDVKVLANFDQDATPYEDMRLRVACTVQRSQGRADLKSHGSEDRPGRQALGAYYSAAAVTADHLGIAPADPAHCADPDSNICLAQKEIGLGNRCDSLG